MIAPAEGSLGEISIELMGDTSKVENKVSAVAVDPSSITYPSAVLELIVIELVTVVWAGGFLIHEILIVKRDSTAHPEVPHTLLNVIVFTAPLE